MLSHAAPVAKPSNESSLTALTIGALGIVYGDIGTSVLYALKEVFATGLIAFTPQDILGILSLFVWTLTVIVSFKYVALVLRADNHGEGGLVAMLALASQAVKDKPALRRVLLGVGIFGTAVFLTPQVGTVPTALLHNLKHNKVLHAQNLFVSVHQRERPWVGLAERVRVQALGLERSQRTRLPIGPYANVVLLVARHGHTVDGRRHGLLAREAVCATAP